MISPNQQEVPLIMAAARLSHIAPDGWQMFLDAMNLYAANQTQSCIQSPIDILPVAQGRAQNAARIQALLAECRTLAEKLEGKKNA